MSDEPMTRRIVCTQREWDELRELRTAVRAERAEAERAAAEANDWKAKCAERDPMTTDTAAMFMKQRDEALRLAGVLYNALLVNREAWRTTNASNGSTRNAQAVTEHAIRVWETGKG
jgi:hypothetical protein